MSDGDSMMAEEEAWEAEISGLLGRLPDVEPPPGFLDKAIDHRPMFAGRTMLGLGLAAVLAAFGVAAAGAFDPDRVVPPIDSFQAQHAAGAAMGEGGGAAAPPVSLPETYEPTGGHEDDDWIVSTYRSDDGPVSVFAQEGRPDWSKMPADGVDEVGGRQAWRDPDGDVAVFETSDRTVTVFGLSEADLVELVESFGGSGGLGDRAQDAAHAFSSELGFGSWD